MDTTLILISFSLLIPSTQSTWSSWTLWSECSRTCDGGVAYQQRNCLSESRKQCEGDTIRYKTCNHKPCPHPLVDYRSQQCSAYNHVAYSDNLYEWIPVYDKHDRCALTCEAKGHRLKVVLASKVLDGTRCDQHSKDMCINGLCKSVGCDNKLNSKQFDKCGVCGGNGSTCQQDDFTKMLSYEEQVIPFDKVFTINDNKKKTSNKRLLLQQRNSNQKNSSVEKNEILNELPHNKDGHVNDQMYNENNNYLSVRPNKLDVYDRSIEVQLYVWEETLYSDCSVTCGPGRQTTTVKCINPRTDEVSPDQFCESPKPSRHAKTCIQKSCNAKWIVGKWGSCSATCGGGISVRNVFCVMSGIGGKKEKVDETLCLRQRPTTKQACNTRLCPHWQPSQWSLCSVTCGAGFQYRPSVCKRYSENDVCQENKKPIEKQKCHTGVICVDKVVDHHEIQRPIILAPEPHKPIVEDDRGADRDENQLAFERPGYDNVYPIGGEGREDKDEDYYRGNFENYSEEYGNELNGRGDNDNSVDYPFYERGDKVMESESETSGDGEEENTQLVISEKPSFYAGKWSPCDVTCGHGYRHRTVQCRQFSTYSNRIIVLDDSNCSGKKADTSEECIEENCPIIVVDQTSRNAYAWQFAGYQRCSATCGGGMREPLFYCVRSDPTMHITVHEELCTRLPLPNVLKESCNTFECPASFEAKPRWRKHEYGACSHRCGGGISHRQVDCVIPDGSSSRTIPEALCLGTMPAKTKLCNLVTCPPEWATGHFSKCSVTCGKGKSTRSVTCVQITPPSRDIKTLDDGFCQFSAKPGSTRTCEEPQCRAFPVLKPDTSYYVQLQDRKQLRFVAGGTLVIIPGTVLRLRCPVTKFDRAKIVWTRNGQVVTRKGRVKKSKRGVLHIRGAEMIDRGVYTCHVGTLTASTTLRLHRQQDALDKYLFRESKHARDPEFFNLFRQQIKKTGTNKKEEYTEPYLFQHFDPEMLPFNFITGEWGSCSRNCGGAGLQSRQISCELNLDQYYLVVDDRYCLDKGFDKPITTQDCGFQVCPEWKVGDWTLQCTDRMCLGEGIGVKTRPLYCTSYNGSLLDNKMCDRNKKPRDTQPCPMSSCVPTWKETDWTSCSRSCGGEGIRTRSLQCIWVPNKKPANGACDRLVKPNVMKPCHTEDCDDTYCQDDSNYCSLVKMLNLCRYSEYRTKCCASCTAIGRPPLRLHRYRFT